jgi:RND family efflux transporter MFP subunit
MKHYRYAKLVAVALLTISLTACSKQQNDENKATANATESKSVSIPVVITTILTVSEFDHNIVSNGHIKAHSVADLYFRSSEVVSEVYVHNGQRVGKGQAIARLDLFKLNNERAKQKTALEQAKLELKDVLIGQGYDPENMSAIPADVVQLARVRSGLEQAEANYNATVRDIEEATLRAPYAGVVANLKAKAHTLASQSEAACSIINDAVMDIEFPVLESELSLVAVGNTVNVTPYNDSETVTGRVIEINPTIDDTGHVTVKAQINKSRGLVDGMNARVSVNRSLGNKLVVPKTAVVLRSGRQVVFTYENGKAIWNYVHTGLENMDSYVIEDGLTEGQVVITSGNENLAHESPVTIKK